MNSQDKHSSAPSPGGSCCGHSQSEKTPAKDIAPQSTAITANVAKQAQQPAKKPTEAANKGCCCH